MMAKKKVSFFISYAHKNNAAKNRFMDLFIEQTMAAKDFKYCFWDDKSIMLGDDWHEAIQKAIQNCEFGILLVSPAFLSSKYIVENELPGYLRVDGKRCFPVMISPVDFDRHDLRGLEKKQIFRLGSSDFSQPRAFTELRSSNRKEEFARILFAKIHDWLEENEKSFS